jgi:hypothetical protein
MFSQAQIEAGVLSNAARNRDEVFSILNIGVSERAEKI